MMNEKEEIKKIKRQFWLAFGIFMAIVALVVIGYLILSTLNFFG